MKGATTVMGVIAERYGNRHSGTLVFPGAGNLSDIRADALPMPKKRAMAIRELARRILSGDVDFSEPDDAVFRASLLDIPGIGPWTAEYIAMRARGNPDAFLHGDLVIRKTAASLMGLDRENLLLDRAETWRPWRGYAGIHLWRYASDNGI